MHKKTYSRHNAYGPDSTVSFDEAQGLRRREEALSGLEQMVHRFSNYEHPVLRLAPALNTLWLENAAFESLLYARIDPAVALGTHEFFFRFQREDGLLPCILGSSIADKTSPAYGRFGMIQQNVPLARTSLELAKLTRNEEFLAKAYAACSRFDDWVRRYRDTRGTGMVEMFCMFDLGQDNSPRCTGIGMPGPCRDGDATKCPAGPNLPVLAPDLSAVVYGARCALAEMADALDNLALRALLWMEHYGKSAELRILMERWMHIHLQHGFYWQVNPWTGDPSVAIPDIAFFTGGKALMDVNVCYLAWLEFTRRLGLLP
jgi:hypothetical protein